MRGRASSGVHYFSLTPLFKPMKGEVSHSLQRANVFDVCSTADLIEAFECILRPVSPSIDAGLFRAGVVLVHFDYVVVSFSAVRS